MSNPSSQESSSGTSAKHRSKSVEDAQVVDQTLKQTIEEGEIHSDNSKNNAKASFDEEDNLIEMEVEGDNFNSDHSISEGEQNETSDGKSDVESSEDEPDQNSDGEQFIRGEPSKTDEVVSPQKDSNVDTPAGKSQG